MTARQPSRIRLQCQDVSRLLSDGQDQRLPATDRARLRLHLVLCQACRNVSEQMDFLRRAMRQLDRDRLVAGAGAAPQDGTGADGAARPKDL